VASFSTSASLSSPRCISLDRLHILTDRIAPPPIAVGWSRGSSRRCGDGCRLKRGYATGRVLVARGAFAILMFLMSISLNQTLIASVISEGRLELMYSNNIVVRRLLQDRPAWKNVNHQRAKSFTVICVVVMFLNVGIQWGKARPPRGERCQ
jgi:hypothetical protein